MRFKTISLLSMLSIISFAVSINCVCKGNANTHQKDNIPKVYMTKKVNADSLLEIYKALQRKANGKVAIKIHMGEPGNKNYISPSLLAKLTKEVNGSFVDANTAFGGRSTTKAHLKAAKDHGFTYAPVDILDADGEISLPIKGGKNLKEALLGSHYKNYDFIISVAHFKGHSSAGFGGTFKNLAIGMATPKGKLTVHSGKSDGGFYSSDGPDKFLERIAEYSKAVMDDMGERILYINVLANLSVDCDCMRNADRPTMDDIGILASLDPVAIDKASVDLVFAAAKEGKHELVNRIKSRKGGYVLEYAEKLGLGSQKYELVMLK
jgi:uncharacterized Fe-S center protein